MWLASVGSIVVISLVGLLAVAALPLLRGKHRKAALQVLEMVVMVLVLVVVLMMLMLVLEVMVVALVMLMLVVSVKVTMEKNQHVAKKVFAKQIVRTLKLRPQLCTLMQFVTHSVTKRPPEKHIM